MKTIVLTIIFLASFGFSFNAQAGLFSDIKDAVTGHVSDIKDRVLNEEVIIEGVELGSGEFRRDDIGRDPIHWANGKASIQRGRQGALYVQLHENFEAGLAPDLHIYIADKKVVDEGSFWKAETIELSRLTRSKGASAYEIDPSILNQSHIEVVIWCKRFGAFIAATTIEIN